MNKHLRKVEFTAYVQDGSKRSVIKGTGYFHQWATNYRDYESGPAQFTYGIVEHDLTGKVYDVVPTDIQFFDDPKH